MEEETIDIEELKISDKLAVERTIQAEGRSLLAWVRTSLSLIAFGFTLFKFFQYLQQTGAAPRLLRSQTPRNIGLFLITTGTIPLLLAIIQYVRATKRLGKKGLILLDPNFMAAGVIFLFGALLIIAVVLRITFP